MVGCRGVGPWVETFSAFPQSGEWWLTVKNHIFWIRMIQNHTIECFFLIFIYSKMYDSILCSIILVLDLQDLVFLALLRLPPQPDKPQASVELPKVWSPKARALGSRAQEVDQFHPGVVSFTKKLPHQQQKDRKNQPLSRNWCYLYHDFEIVFVFFAWLNFGLQIFFWQILGVWKWLGHQCRNTSVLICNK